MKVIYEPIAERELRDAAAYIARRDSSIEAAEDLLTDAAATEDLIQQFPNSAPPLTKGKRRCLLSRHDYQIVYRVEGEII